MLVLGARHAPMHGKSSGTAKNGGTAGNAKERSHACWASKRRTRNL
jgi:hypothetical protein